MEIEKRGLAVARVMAKPAATRGGSGPEGDHRASGEFERAPVESPAAAEPLGELADSDGDGRARGYGQARGCKGAGRDRRPGG